MFFLIWNHQKSLSKLFSFPLNTHVSGLRPLYIFYSFSAGMDFRRHNLTSDSGVWSRYLHWKGLTLMCSLTWAISVNSWNTELHSICIFSHLKLCLAIAIHNFKWLEITQICEIKVPTDNSVWRFNPLAAKLFNLNFHPLQVSVNYSDLIKWRSNVFKSCWLMSHLSLTCLKCANKKWKPEYMRHRRLKG